MEIPFIGPSYNLDSRESGVQRTINLIPHPQEPGNERTAWVFKDVPGLVLVQDFEEEPDVLVIAFNDANTQSFTGSGINGGSFAVARPLTASTYASHQGSGKIQITQTGVYEVDVTYVVESTKMETDPVELTSFIQPDGYSSAFEVYPSGNRAIAVGGDAIAFVDESRVAQTTQFILNVYQAPVEFFPTVSGNAAASTPEFDLDMTVVVRRSGASIYTPP